MCDEILELLSTDELKLVSLLCKRKRSLVKDSASDQYATSCLSSGDYTK
jgi:hypothetical protein